MDIAVQDTWILACRIWGDYRLTWIASNPIPGVKWLEPERYVEIQVEKLYFSREVFHD
jgi:hypothetical protein